MFRAREKSVQWPVLNVQDVARKIERTCPNLSVVSAAGEHGILGKVCKYRRFPQGLKRVMKSVSPGRKRTSAAKAALILQR